MASTRTKTSRNKNHSGHTYEMPNGRFRTVIVFKGKPVTAVGGTAKESNAHQWFLWVNSMGPLPGQSPEDYEIRMSQLTTEEDMKYEQPREILTAIELNRAINASYFSPISPGISAHEVFFPGLQPEVNGRFFLEDAERKIQPADRELTVFQNKVTFLTFARRGLRLMEEFETEGDIKKAIKWSLNQMGNALAAIAVNRLRKLKK